MEKENLSAASPPGDRIATGLSPPPRLTSAIVLFLMTCPILFFVIFFFTLDGRQTATPADIELRAKGQPIGAPYVSVKWPALIQNASKKENS